MLLQLVARLGKINNPLAPFKEFWAGQIWPPWMLSLCALSGHRRKVMDCCFAGVPVTQGWEAISAALNQVLREEGLVGTVSKMITVTWLYSNWRSSHTSVSGVWYWWNLWYSDEIHQTWIPYSFLSIHIVAVDDIQKTSNEKFQKLIIHTICRKMDGTHSTKQNKPDTKKQVSLFFLFCGIWI